MKDERGQETESQNNRKHLQGEHIEQLKSDKKKSQCMRNADAKKSKIEQDNYRGRCDCNIVSLIDKEQK